MKAGDIKWTISRWLFRHGFEFGTKTYIAWMNKTLKAIHDCGNPKENYIV